MDCAPLPAGEGVRHLSNELDMFYETTWLRTSD